MIPIEYEPDPDELRPWLKERCCFCRIRTDWWTNIPSRKPGEQVACCEACAKEYRVKDVPSKRYWCEKEDQISEASRKGHTGPTLSPR